MVGHMALHSFYRSEALEHKERGEPIDGLAQVTVPYDWLVLAVLAVVCAAIVGWGALGKVERTLRAEALIVVPDDRRAVVAPVGGRLTERLVEPGDRVDAGEPLARVAVPELERRLAVARERERVIREELPDAEPAAAGLRRMLIDARAEAAALSATIARDNVVASPVAGTVIEHRLAPGAMVAAGEEVAWVRAGPPAAPVAVASVPPAHAASVPPGAPVRLRCHDRATGRTWETRVAEVSPQPPVPPGRLAGAGLDPHGHQLRLALPDAATVAEGDRCELHIVIEARTPLQLLLATTGPD